MYRPACFACGLLTITTALALHPEPPTPPLADVRSAVRRALPYLARQTDAWIETHKCASCHQVPHAVWAMNAARAQGFDVDARLPQWNRWSLGFVLEDTDTSEWTTERAAERVDMLHQMLMSGAVADVRSAATPHTTRDRLAELVLMGQAHAGYWHTGGRLPGQRRPPEETNEVTTMWSMHALRFAPHDGAELDGLQQRVHGHLEVDSTSLEHLVLRYLMARERSGAEAPDVHDLQARILSHQNPDGGWGWLLGDSSDALATGQALYGLSFMESPPSRAATARAQQFLLNTQQPDGSWHVPSTLRDPPAAPYVVSNDWGTAWAVIGLARTLRP